MFMRKVIGNSNKEETRVIKKITKTNVWKEMPLGSLNIRYLQQKNNQ